MKKARKNQNKVHQSEKVSKIGDVKKNTADAKTVSKKNHLNSKEPINSKEPKSSPSDKIQQKREIITRTKEYVDEPKNNPLKLDQSEDGGGDVSSWEDLLDDDSYIQDKLFTEIAEKVVTKDVPIIKASDDSAYDQSKPDLDYLEHVVELYDFPSSFETHDLVQAFRGVNSDAMYIKRVDGTHALLVLGSSTQAQRAIGVKNPLIKARRMWSASAVAVDFAKKSDLKPAMKRPQTSLQTARRLIISHLGAKSRLTKEEMTKEKQDLKEAKETRKLIKQSENDAWEGTLHSSIP